MSPLRCLLLALLLGSSALAAPPADADPVVARVNGMTITASEFQAAAARRTPANGVSYTPEEREAVMQSLVEEKLLYQRALEQHLDKDPKVQKVMINTLLRDDLYSQVKNSDYTDEMLQDYYNAHKDQFIVPEKVQIRYILVAVTDTRSRAEARDLARDLHRQLEKNPALFSDLAAERSDDAYRRRGGDVGFVGKEGKPGLDPKVVQAAWDLPTGAVSGVFEVEGGYGIVMAAARREAVERTFQQMKGSVLRQVKNEAMKARYDAYVADLMKGATVKVDDRAVNALEVTPLPTMPSLGQTNGALIGGTPGGQTDLSGGADGDCPCAEP